MHKSRSFPTFRGLNTVRWYLVLFPRYQLLNVWHRCHKNGPAVGLPRQSTGLRADFTEKMQPLRSDWSTYDPSGAECWSNAPLQGQARLKYTFARLLKPWRDFLIFKRDFLILNETLCWLARPKDAQTRLIVQSQYQMSKYQTIRPKYYTRLTKSRLFGPIFHSILVWRGEMSVSRGKSSFGEEKVLLARKKSFPRGNTSHWRGTMYTIGERC